MFKKEASKDEEIELRKALENLKLRASTESTPIPLIFQQEQNN